HPRSARRESGHLGLHRRSAAGGCARRSPLGAEVDLLRGNPGLRGDRSLLAFAGCLNFSLEPDAGGPREPLAGRGISDPSALSYRRGNTRIWRRPHTYNRPTAWFLLFFTKTPTLSCSRRIAFASRSWWTVRST